jgi:hypothetical protein
MRVIAVGLKTYSPMHGCYATPEAHADRYSLERGADPIRGTAVSFLRKDRSLEQHNIQKLGVHY